MSVDIEYPSTFDMLMIYDNMSNLLMEVPLCEVIPGDFVSIVNNTVKMKIFGKEEFKEYPKSDILDIVQNYFTSYYPDIDYIEIITAKDQTKIKITN
jgi:hypothetical protein